MFVRVERSSMTESAVLGVKEGTLMGGDETNAEKSRELSKGGLEVSGACKSSARNEIES